MNWNELWMNVFGTTHWLGLDLGFWVSMAVVALIVVAMNVVFWGMKPQNNRQSKPKPAVFLMDFAPEMLLFLFKTRKNSSLCS